MDTAVKAAFLGLMILSPLAQAEAPFGLAWGASERDIAALGVNITRAHSSGEVVSYGAARLPDGTSNAKAYSLFIDAKHGLQRVTMVTEPISNDLVGEEGKQQYALMKLSLSRKYGSPLGEYEYAGNGYQVLPSEFYACLSLKDCGSWVSVFDGQGEGERVSLRLSGTAPTGGYISISYEGPQWKSIADRLSEH